MNVDQRETAFATLQVTGDRIDPADVTAILGLQPTFGVRKGQSFRRARSDREYVGRTGIWNLTTKDSVHSARLDDHLAFLQGLIAARRERFAAIREFIHVRSDWAGVSCFWFGAEQSPEPWISDEFRDLVRQIGGEIETDFHRDGAFATQDAAE